MNKIKSSQEMADKKALLHEMPCQTWQFLSGQKSHMNSQ